MTSAITQTVNQSQMWALSFILEYSWRQSVSLHRKLIVEKLPRKRKLEETGTVINLHVGEVHAVQVTEHLVDL